MNEQWKFNMLLEIQNAPRHLVIDLEEDGSFINSAFFEEFTSIKFKLIEHMDHDFLLNVLINYVLSGNFLADKSQSLLQHTEVLMMQLDWLRYFDEEEEIVFNALADYVSVWTDNIIDRLRQLEEDRGFWVIPFYELFHLIPRSTIAVLRKKSMVKSMTMAGFESFSMVREENT